MKQKHQNILFAALLLAVAAVLAVAAAGRGQGAVAVLTYESGQQTKTLPLNKDAVYEVQSNGYSIRLVVEGGSIRFANSPCPDHLCEGYGRLSKDGDWAACLPAAASVVVQQG